MPFDKFYIVPFESGLVTNVKPFLIPDDAFSLLTNSYVFRGRVVKRFGGTLMGNSGTGLTAPLLSRMRVNLGTTSGAGNLSGTVPGNVFAVGQQFSIGNEIFTVSVTGAPAVLLTTGATPTRTYNTTTGAFNFAGAAANTAVYFYPATPVMGLTQYESGANNSWPTYGFDTQFAYVYNNGWSRSGTTVWRGSDSQLFWTTNYQGAPGSLYLFVSNFNATIGVPGPNDDPMYYFDGTNWVNFSALTVFNGSGDYVQTARMIIPFKGSLLLLNTIENVSGANISYVNRCRYSALAQDPTGANAWIDEISGGTFLGAGAIDAPTKEPIISSEFIKDRLIVYFARSTWEIIYTGNISNPFEWQKINTELGSQATFSTIPFDKAILGISDIGVHSCTGANVERIDIKIPQATFLIRQSNNGPNRVYGIRDYYQECAYWAYPLAGVRLNRFNDNVLVYNYRNNTWAINFDCITAFGYYQRQEGLTWGNSVLTWEDINDFWDSGNRQAQAREVIAGNQQGYTFIVDANASRNAPVMQITNIVGNTLTIINHNLTNSEYIAIENAQGITITDSTGVVRSTAIFPVFADNPNTVTLDLTDYLHPDDQGNFPGSYTITGTYTGGGTATRVSNIVIDTKQWNPYDKEDRNVYLQRIDFCVETTTAGQVEIDYRSSSADLSILRGGKESGSIMGTGILETFPQPNTLEVFQDRVWHPVYFQSDGECIQLFISMNNTQITNPAIAWEPFELHGMILWTQKTTYRLQ